MKKKYLFLLLGLAAAVLFFGCTKSGYLEVTNNTNDKLWISFDDSSLDNGEDVSSGNSSTEEYTDLGYTPFQQESIDADYTVGGYYKFTEDLTATVTAGETTSKNVSADAGGILIKNSNYYGYPISQIYIVDAPNGYNGSWGSDLYYDYLYNGESYYYTIGSGTYDIAIIDTSGNGRLKYSLIVSTDSHREITYYGYDYSFGIVGLKDSSEKQFSGGNLSTLSLNSGSGTGTGTVRVEPRETVPAD